MSATATVRKHSIGATAFAEGLTKAESLKAISEGQKRVETSLRSTFQSIGKNEAIVHDQAVLTVGHASKYGDVMPAHRLVLAVRNIGLEAKAGNIAKTMYLELVDWYRQNSPIRWNEKGQPYQAKEGERGYKAYNLEQADEVPFYQTDRATKAREDAFKATQRSLGPAITPMIALKRLKGMLKWLTDAASEEVDGEHRTIVRKAKIEKALTAAIRAAEDTFTEADLNAKPTEVVDEAKVSRNVKLLKKGSRAHKAATRARKAATRARKGNGHATEATSATASAA